MVLPRGSTVDCLVAEAEIHEAEALTEAGDIENALTHAAVASMIASRPALPEVTHSWVDALGLRMQAIHIRALDALVRLWTLRGQYFEAIVDAEKLLAIDHLHESAYAGLMQAYLRSGNPSMGLRTYGRCRQVLQQELGSSPGPEVARIYQDLLAIT
jgi:DNA-binding SARP family transcriptional activator